MIENDSKLTNLLSQIRACRICRDQPMFGQPLPQEPNPVCVASSVAPIAICGQAPGIRVHNTGIPFNDPSGIRLRQWLNVTPEEFYDESRFAIIPMGFCFPGHDKHGGDLPPRRECRLTWHKNLFSLLPQLKLIILVGQYAQNYHLQHNSAYQELKLAHNKHLNVTETVQNWRSFLESEQNDTASPHPLTIPLPHPSWRNSSWLKRNPWFESELLPEVQLLVRQLL